MTTIAVTRDQIACDLQITHPNGYKFKCKTKIFEYTLSAIYPEPFVLGYCGNPDSLVGVQEYLLAGGKVPKNPKNESEFVVLTQSGKIFNFYKADEWFEIDQDYYAIGSGGAYALGAMASGADARTAVLAAINQDPKSGFGVKSFSF